MVYKPFKHSKATIVALRPLKGLCGATRGSTKTSVNYSPKA